MEQNNQQLKNRQIMLAIIGIAVFIVGLIGITYAFFNYTRTGTANNIRTGRIYFNTSQNGRLNLTNLFPVSSSQAGNANLDSITVRIQGDTTYAGGEEFEISLVSVNNSIVSGSTEKSIPIGYIASYEPTPVATGETTNNIGTSSNDYFNNRGSTTAVYQLKTTGSVSEGEQVLVGFIPKDVAIDGTLTIKAYLDGDNLAISDTYPEGDVTHTESSGETSVEVVDYTNGTTSEWVNGRNVLTTEEWNSFQNTPISFKIKAEANEGIWVEEQFSINAMGTFSYDIFNSVGNKVIEINFVKMNKDTMLTRYENATIKEDVTYNNEGKVLAWLENDTIDNTKYIMYVASDGKTYLTTANIYLFNHPGLTYAEKITFNNVDTSRITDMSSMFFRQSGLKELDITSFDTSNVVNMQSFVYIDSNIESINMSGLDLRKVQNMSSMFYSNPKLVTVNLNGVKTRDVTNMSQMFYHSPKITNIDISGLGGDNLTNVSSMFEQGGDLETINMSHFNFGNVTDISGMFRSMTKLESVNLSDSNMSNITSMSNAFNGDSNLINVDFTNVTLDNVQNMAYMFIYNSSLEELNLSGLGSSQLGDMTSMLSGCTNLRTVNMSNFNFGTASLTSLFSELSNLETVNLSNVNMSNTLSMAYLFNNDYNLEKIYVSNSWNVDNVPSSYNMFYGCTSLVGGNGTEYDSTKTDKAMAVIDTLNTPGYLTLKTD